MLFLCPASSSQTRDLKEIALRLAHEIPTLKERRMVVITQGKDPVLVVGSSDDLDEVLEFPVPALNLNEIVDTNGAGDAFAGGFLARFAQRKTTEYCVRTGIVCAREIIKRPGCSLPEYPYSDDLLE